MTCKTLSYLIVTVLGLSWGPSILSAFRKNCAIPSISLPPRLLSGIKSVVGCESGGGDIPLASRGSGIGSRGELTGSRGGVVILWSRGVGMSRGALLDSRPSGGNGGSESRGVLARSREGSGGSVAKAWWLVKSSADTEAAILPPCTLRRCSDFEPDLERCLFFSRTCIKKKYE